MPAGSDSGPYMVHTCRSSKQHRDFDLVSAESGMRSRACSLCHRYRQRLEALPADWPADKRGNSWLRSAILVRVPADGCF